MQKNPTSTDAHAVSPDWRGDLLWASAIFVAALVLRIVYVLQLRASPWFADPQLDALFHHEWALAFSRGERFVDGPFFRAPLYTWFVGTVYWLFGSGALTWHVVQAALGSINCVLLYFVSRVAFCRTVGALAGLAGATYWIFIYFDAELLSPVLIVFLNLLLVLALLRARTGSCGWWAIAGVLLGLSAIARPDILAFAPLVVVWIAIRAWSAKRRLVRDVALFAGGCALVILPITIRNCTVGGDCVLIATNGGVNLYIGNNPGADGLAAVIPGDPLPWREAYAVQVARAERDMGRPLKASEVSGYYARKAREYVRTHPGEALARALRKLGYFWSRWENPNNQDIHFVTSTYTPLVRFLPLNFWIVAPLGVVGMVLTLRRPWEYLPLWGVVIVYMAVVTAFFVTARFRVPAAAILLVLAAYAVVWMVRAARARRWAPLTGALAGVVVMAAIATPIPANADRLSVQGHRYAGFALAQKSQFAKAEQMLQKTLELARQTRETLGAELPGAREANALTWRVLGFCQLKQEKVPAAEQSYERSLELDPASTTARREYAMLLLYQRRVADAIALLRNGEATDAVPLAEYLVEQTGRSEPTLLGALAQAYLHARRANEAKRVLDEAISLATRQNRSDLAESLKALQRSITTDTKP